MKMKNLDIEMHNALDITNMTQTEIETAIKDVLSGKKTFEQVAAEKPAFDVGTIVEVKALHGASQRTRNRIRERGAQGFEVIKRPQTASFADNRGVQWVLLDSKDSEWRGWLPVDELEVVNASR